MAVRLLSFAKANTIQELTSYVRVIVWSRRMHKALECIRVYGVLCWVSEITQCVDPAIFLAAILSVKIWNPESASQSHKIQIFWIWGAMICQPLLLNVRASREQILREFGWFWFFKCACDHSLFPSGQQYYMKYIYIQYQYRPSSNTKAHHLHPKRHTVCHTGGTWHCQTKTYYSLSKCIFT